jgi:hypothetical protein
MDRKTQTYATGMLEIEHAHGREHHYGDTTLTATPKLDAFNLELSVSTGRDRDNRDSWEDAEIDMNVEEARELHLLLHMWLERHG